MRRLIVLSVAGAETGASLDAADGAVGVLLVTGGTQTRIGSHRLFERLARSLAAAGLPCIRFDRRGVGDSGGTDPGWRGSGPEIEAAARALRESCPSVQRVIGLGLCDGASALCLAAAAAGIDGLVLVNPWLVETEPGALAPAALRHHYRERLKSAEGWKRFLFGAVSYRKVLTGVRSLGSAPSKALAGEVAAALGGAAIPFETVLARGDATAIAAADALARLPLSQLVRRAPATIDTDSHTFARPGDEAKLLEAVLAAVRRLSGGG
jgi:exosortase A-associated hydrolase 1